MQHNDQSSPRNAKRQTLLMAALCGLVGLVAGLWIWHGAEGHGFLAFVAAAPISGFLSGGGVWWWMRARRGKSGALGGAVAGALAAVLGHWLCWYGILLGGYLCNVVSGGCTGSLGDAPMNPAQALAGASVYSFASLFILGWATVPAGAIIGAFVGRNSPHAAETQRG